MLLAVQLAGSELLTFIVYVVPLSPLTTVGSFTVTSPVCPFTDSTPVFVIALSRVITQVSHHRRLELLELSQPYGAELLVINVLDE
jgi:hypothetical protein